MLMETKFDNLDSVYAGSQIIATVQNRLADALEAADAGTGWSDWRRADRHNHRLEAIQRYVAGLGERWLGMSQTQRELFVRSLLAPLRASDAQIAEIMRQAPTS